MDPEPMPVIAWVESPLQLVGVAEWAAAHRRRVPIAGRLTPHMAETSDELVARGALFGRREPYWGIPWNLLARHGHWLIGDGFSGQFRLAVAVLRPRRITFLDDGANALAFADAVTDARPFARPGVDERARSRVVVPFARERLLRCARGGGIDFFTAFEFGASRVGELADRGIAVRRHAFEWTRRTARAFITTTHGRILLGSARPGDGLMPLAEYLDWVRREAADAPLTYLPHRRETDEQLRMVAAIPGVVLSRPALPVEMLLAGAIERLEILTLPSSTTTTLPLVLRGSRSAIRTETAARVAVDGGAA